VGGSAAGRTEAWADRRPPGFTKSSFAFVGGISQHIPDGLVIPGRFARARPDARLMAMATYRIPRAAFLSDPRKHLLPHARFVPDDINARVSAACRLGPIPVAVRCLAPDPDTPRLRGVPLAPSAPFQKFGALVFGNHALHVQPHLIFRRVPQGASEKDDLDPALCQFLKEQDLIGVMARQAIGTMHVEAIEPARRGDIASALEGWSHQ